MLALTALAGIHVDVEGSKFFSAHTIKEYLPLDPKDFGEEDLAVWREDAGFQASDLYRRSGFFDARVDVDLQRGSDPQDWKALVKIDEGQRYVFDTVRVLLVADTARGSGDSVLVSGHGDSAATVPDTLGLVQPGDLDARPGKPYKEELIFSDRQTVLRKLGDGGFVRAQVDDRVAVKPESRTVRVDYLADPSYAVVFDTLVVMDRRAPPYDSLEGITDEGIFQGLVPYKRGDTVRVSRNDRLIEKLQYTGAFNYVRLRDSLLPGPSRRSALTLITEEHIPGNLRASVFWENQYGPGVSLDGSHNNVAGSLNQVRTGFSIAALRQRVYAGYGSPLTLGVLVRFDDDLDVNWTQAEALSDSKGLFAGNWQATNSARLTWPWSYWLRLIENAELDAKSRLIAEGRERSMNLNYIQTAALTFTNEALDPTRGFRSAFSWGNGGPFLEDHEVAFTKRRHNWFEAQTGYYYYFPAVRQVKLAARLDGGRFIGEGEANSERFYLGGSRSVRSYGFRELCPDRVSTPDGAVCSDEGVEAAYYLTSFETRLSLFDFGFIDPRGKLRSLIPLQTVAFYDLGRSWNLLTPPADTALTTGQGRGQAYGVGFRYPLLGIFNFRLDFAWGRPNRSRWPDAWILDLAEAF